MPILGAIEKGGVGLHGILVNDLLSINKVHMYMLVFWGTNEHGFCKLQVCLSNLLGNLQLVSEIVDK